MTRESPRITVLMAVKEGLPWVRDAVASVLAQTYCDFELLVVDDASSDGTIDAVLAFGDPRVRVLRNEHNIGQAPSLNRGLEEARGKYVARLDADDRMLPACLDRQAAVLDGEPPVALVGTWMDVLDEEDRLWARLRGHVRDFPEFVFAILADKYPWGHPSVMYRLDVVRGLGGYNPALAPSEDKDLYRRLALGRHEARSIEEPLVLYRRHDAQLSQQHADVQQRTDHDGQERFVAAVVDPDHARRLRVLLSSGVDQAGQEPELLERLLHGTRRRLGLEQDEHARLESLLAGHLARRALLAGVCGYRTLAWASRRRPAAVAAFPLLPLAVPARRAGASVREVARSAPLDSLRRHARRSKLLRSIYSRLG